MAASSGTHKMCDVLVVGAGLSGLQAALSVRSAGFSVCVVEAINRVGGKTLTVQSCEKGFNDMGASWINDTNQKEMFKLYQRYGIDMEIQRACGNTLMQSSDGSVVKLPYGQLPIDTDVVLDLFQVFRDECSLIDLDNPTNSASAREIDQLTFREFCAQKAQSNSAIDIADVLSNSLLGIESDEVSALCMLLYFKSGSGIDNIVSDGKDGGQYLRNRQGKLYKLVSEIVASQLTALGNQTISQKMAEELGSDAVFLRMPVTSIDQSQHGSCVVQTDGGITFQCQRVIVSIPSTLHHKIMFNPRLPDKKVTLSSNTITGYYTKVVYVFKEPWWQKASFSGVLDSEKGPIVFTRDTSIPVDDQWSITCFITGDKGRNWSKLPQAVRHKQAWDQFSRSFGAFTNVPQAANTLEMDWTKDSFFLGAPCPVTGPGILSIVGSESAMPFGRVHFVGTETSRVWRGYMEGAVQSGQRGAAEVVKALSMQPAH